MKYLFFASLVVLCSFSCENNPMGPSDDDEGNDGHPSETFNVTYGDHPLQTFELITPEDSDETTKVAILVHGGGWVMGYEPSQPVTTFRGRYNWDLETPLLEQGIAVLTMKYRTACYNTQPAEFGNDTHFYIDRMREDIDLVVEDLQANAVDYKINPDHLQLVGESGGGHIVMYYGIHADAKPEVKSVVSMFGPTNLDAQDFKQIISSVPLLPVGPPNYFLKQSENCTSVTNQQVRTWFSLKSFADHNDIEVNQANDFLDSLSTTFAPNIANNIPLFITHGSDDALVPVSQADAMFAAMSTRFGAPACDETDFSCQLKLSKYPNCGHGWTNGNCSRNTVMDNIVEWLEEH